MKVKRVVRGVAGFVVPVSHMVGARVSPLFHHAHWPWLRAFVGFNQFQSGFTKLCPLEIIVKSAGVKQAECGVP